MEAVLSVVSVILVTAEELQTLTGIADVSKGCEQLFQMHGLVLQWVVVKLGSAGPLCSRDALPVALASTLIQDALTHGSNPSHFARVSTCLCCSSTCGYGRV